MADREQDGHGTRAILGTRDEQSAQRAKAAGWRIASRAEAAALRTAWEEGRFHLLTWPADRIASPVFGRTSERDRRATTRPSLPAIEALLAQSADRGAGEVVLLLLAPSRLDLANAAHGRASVDGVLAEIERRIGAAVEAILGTAAVVERIDGAEFVVAARCRSDTASAAAASLDAALARPFATDAGEARLGFRLAVVTAVPGDTVAALLGRAEAGLAHEPAALPSVDALAIDLHHALGRDEIALRFQPQVETDSGRILGVEALVRWSHPALGDLGAETLFATAARAGLAVALSDRIQTLVLERAACWPQALAGLRVSLNLEAADLIRPGFASLFIERIDRSGFPRNRLTVEVTETGLIRDLDAVAAVLAALRYAGCRVAIDDFGTGYSSLAYLKALPLDYLKIDKALIRDLDGSPRDRVVVESVIGMARGLGLSVIAEGVERQAQRELLAAAGCAAYQGYLAAEPLDEVALIRLIEENR